MAKQKIQMDEITENIPAFESSDFFYKDLTEFEQMVWRLMKPNKGVVNLMSPPGFGKTAFAKSFAEKIGKLFIELHLTSYEETDIAGYPRVKLHNDTEVMHYAIPEWAVLAYESATGTVTLMDEANRCKPAVMNATLRILNEKRIGYSFRYKPNDYFILTGNLGSFSKEGDGAEVNAFDSAMMGRLYPINLLDYIGMWNEHWIKVVGPTICKPLLNYLKTNPHMIYQYNEENGEEAYPSHRSNTNLSEHLRANLGDDKFNSIPHILSLKNDFPMIIGPAAAYKFIAYLHDMNKINGMSIMDGLDTIWDIVKEYPKSRHQELLDDIKNNFKFETITKRQTDNLKTYLMFVGETLGLDDVVAGMLDFLFNYDIPDYEREEERDQEHLNRLKEYRFVTPYFADLIEKMKPELPFEIVE